MNEYGIYLRKYSENCLDIRRCLSSSESFRTRAVQPELRTEVRVPCMPNKMIEPTFKQSSTQEKSIRCMGYWVRQKIFEMRYVSFWSPDVCFVIWSFKNCVDKLLHTTVVWKNLCVYIFTECQIISKSIRKNTWSQLFLICHWKILTRSSWIFFISNL